MDIRPIAELRDTAKIAKLCKESNEPIFITKNGYGEMVVMSMETYEMTMRREEIIASVREGEKDVAEGKTIPLEQAFAELREKHAP